MAKKMKIEFLLPAYNEKDNVVDLTKRIYKVMKKEKIDFEIIYIIQGMDGALEQLIDLKKKGYNKMRMYHYNNPLGIGPAFIKAFNRMSKEATHVVTMDADLNHQPEEIPMFIKKMEDSGKEIIIGSRKVSGGIMINMPWYKKLISGTVNIILPRLYGLKAKDITSGYRLFRSDVIKKVRSKIKSKNFEVYPEILMIANKKGFSMAEVPIKFKFRIHGESKLNFFSSGFGYLKLLFRSLFI